MVCKKICLEQNSKPLYSYSGPYKSKITYQNIVSDLDIMLIPKSMYDAVINREKNKIIAFVQSHPQYLFWTYNFNQMLKFSYNQSGSKKIGCCYKMLWTPYGGNKYKIVSFNQMVNLYTYLIIYNRHSNLAYYNNVVLKIFQNMNLARQMLGNNKSYPYQNLVKNTNKNRGKVIMKKCNCFNKLGYKNYKKINLNEYLYWFMENNIFTPYKSQKIDIIKYNKKVNNFVKFK